VVIVGGGFGGLGALLSFPGVSYLTALGRIAKVDPGTVATVQPVVGFCRVDLLTLEAPLPGLRLRPPSGRSARWSPSAPGWPAAAERRW
jgi:hypothetical protein